MVFQCKEVTNTNNNANQNENWARFSSWWDSNKCNLDLDAAIFTVPKEQFTTLNAAEMVLEVSHLQRAHILAAYMYIGKLKPAKQNMTHLQGNSLKNYLDAICRRIQQLENSTNAASEKFGNWSVHSHNQYHIVRQVLSRKVTKKLFANPSKQKKSRVSDFITNWLFKMLIDCTLELAEEYKRDSNVHNYVKTTAACAVFVITVTLTLIRSRVCFLKP